VTLKTRIIPILLTDGKGNVVKPVKFERPYRTVGSLMQHIRVMERRNIDELIILDIEATNEGRLIDAERIRDYTKELYCPVTLGGGIRSLGDINTLLSAGADKVAIKTNYWLVEKAAIKFGSQAIVSVIDIHPGYVYIDYITHAKGLERSGAGEILLTDMSKDGTMEGYNTDILYYLCDTLDIPVIVNGGCSGPEDMEKALKHGAHAVAAGSMFLYKDITPRACAKYLKSKGFDMRIE
jgi:cyclase